METPEYKPEKWNEKSSVFGFSNVNNYDFTNNAFNQILRTNPKSILDIGCCTGDYIMAWREAGYEGEYLGLDITPNFIESSKKRLPNEKFEVANLYEYTSDKKYDIVVCQNVLMHLPDVKTAIEKIFSFTDKYVFLSFYGTKGETSESHNEDFINYHYNISDITKHIPKGFALIRDCYFDNGYNSINIIQLLVKKQD
jgi:ubiquinone/menaquinone biosynthesis C-methylase UbiE